MQEHLAEKLMQMHPQDDFLLNQEQNWMLADNKQQTVLLYSLGGTEIKLAQKLKGKHYIGTWFDPETGETVAAQLPKSLKKGAAVSKPSQAKWLLLLQ